MTQYYQLAHMSDGIIRVDSAMFGPQVFTRRKLRKLAECASCGKVIHKGDEAWGHSTSSALNRMHRVHTACIIEERTP